MASICPTPDLVLIDANLSEVEDQILSTHGSFPHSRVIVVGVEPTTATVIGAIHAGATAIAPADATTDDILRMVNGVARDQVHCPPQISEILFEYIRAQQEAAAPKVPQATIDDQPDAPEEEETIESLTPREREILALIDEGLSNQEIADRLYVGRSTVKNHVHNILSKLHVKRRTQAVARVRRTG